MNLSIASRILLSVTAATGFCSAEVNQVEQIAENVYFHEGDIKGHGHCNNGWVVFQDYVLVIDANFPSGAQEIIPKIKAITGKPIGILPDCAYEEGAINLSPGSTLFLYTDGLNEAADPEDDEFGMDRLRELVATQRDADIRDVPTNVLEAVTAFERGARATDDKTIVVVRRLS